MRLVQYVGELREDPQGQANGYLLTVIMATVA